MYGNLNNYKCIQPISFIIKRLYTCNQLICESFGDPLNVVKMRELTLPKPEENEIIVKVLAAPINPADINTIQGVYGVKPTLPITLGNEGVGEVIEAGSQANIKLKTRVIPRASAMGTWCTHMSGVKEDFIEVPSDIDVISAATIAVNPCTAYRLLKDFNALKCGDVIIQNGANSAVGQAVIQIASSMGIKTINIIRDRPDLEQLKQYLTSLGANIVLTEEELRKTKSFSSLPKPQLGLNCVAGKSGLEILRQLDKGGVLVTYGGMSRQPVQVPVGSLIFSDITLKGFWMTRWNSNHFTHDHRHSMLNDLYSLVRTGALLPPKHQCIQFSDYKSGLQNAMPRQGFVGSKQILVMD